jgi:dipeptidyl aminopeptidase/acylaminoacyl peptidase
VSRSATECISEELLAAFAVGELRGDDVAVVEAHVESCDACRLVLAALGSASAVGTLAPTSRTLDPEAGGEEAHLNAGDTVGRFVVEARIGAGAMGSVYSAHDPELHRRVAIKILHAHGSAALAESHAARMRREAQAMARLSHPNVVAVYDVGTFRQRVFLAMEYVDGPTLRVWLERRKRSWQEVLEAFEQAGRGLAAAHAAALVHRDFKPDNVLVGDNGCIKVTDFGLARLVEAGPGSSRRDGVSTGKEDAPVLTRTGMLAGTPAYMSPEALAGGEVDAISDVFSFSVALYEGLYGRRPFVGTTVAQLLDATTGQAITDPHDGTVPAWLRRAVLCGLAADRGRRYQTIDEVLVALQRPRRTGRGLAAAAIAAAVFAAMGFVVVRMRVGKGVTTTAQRSAARLHSLRTAGVRRVSGGLSCEEFPSLTPDGSSVVFDGTQGGTSNIYVMPLSAGSARAITRAPRWDLAATLSPDGRRVAFVRSDTEQSGAYVVDIDGSTQPRLVALGKLRPSWTPDGRAIWAGERMAPARYDAATGALETKLPVAAGTVVYRVLQTDRGVVAIQDADRSGVAIYGTDGSTRWLLEDDVEEVLALAPGGQSVLVSRLRVTNGVELVVLPLDGSQGQSLASSDVEARKGLWLSSDGGTVAWSTCSPRAEVTRVDTDRLEPLPDGEDWDVSAMASMPGGDRLVVLSQHDGPTKPWIIDRGQHLVPRPIESGGPELWGVAASPDGRWLALQTLEGLRLASVGAEAPQRALTSGKDDDNPQFTRDGREVTFTRPSSSGEMQILAVPIAGGDPRIVVASNAWRGVPSPVDDRFIYLKGDHEALLVPTVRDLRTGKDTKLCEELGEGAYAGLAVSPDGRRVATVQADRMLVEVDLATRMVVRKTQWADAIMTPTYAGKELYVRRQIWTGGIWLAEARWGTEP